MPRLRHVSIFASALLAAALLSGCTPGKPSTCADYAGREPSERTAIAAEVIGESLIAVHTPDGAEALQAREYLDRVCADEETIEHAAEIINGTEPATCRQFLDLDEAMQEEWASVQWDIQGGAPFSSVQTQRELVLHLCNEVEDLSLAGAVESLEGLSEPELLALIGQEVGSPTPQAGAPSGGGQSYTYTRTDDAGFAQTMTVTIRPVILGNDASRMASEWKAVGGQGQNPCFDVPLWAGRTLDHELAGFAFGTMTITNDVPEFPAQPWGYQFSRVGLQFTMMGLQFSNGGSCEKLYEGGYVIQPSWGERTTWGPVPFVIAIADVRSPATPNGDPSLIAAAPVKLYLTDFSIPLTLSGT